jgi:hypothetical protein
MFKPNLRGNRNGNKKFFPNVRIGATQLSFPNMNNEKANLLRRMLQSETDSDEHQTRTKDGQRTRLPPAEDNSHSQMTRAPISQSRTTREPSSQRANRFPPDPDEDIRHSQMTRAPVSQARATREPTSQPGTMRERNTTRTRFADDDATFDKGTVVATPKPRAEEAVSGIESKREKNELAYEAVLMEIDRIRREIGGFEMKTTNNFEECQTAITVSLESSRRAYADVVDDTFAFTSKAALLEWLSAPTREQEYRSRGVMFDVQSPVTVVVLESVLKTSADSAMGISSFVLGERINKNTGVRSSFWILVAKGKERFLGNFRL